MGYVVYEKEYGSARHYYKKESSAKAQVTRLNKYAAQGGYYSRGAAYCSWTDYELMLQGMNPDQIRFYRFVMHPLNT